MKKLKFLLLLLVISSCSVNYNKPQNKPVNQSIPPNIIKVFVDKNGDFYPDDWDNNKYYPLRIPENNYANEIKSAEIRTLKNIKEQSANKDRIFILVHGFNNDENSAKENYHRIENIIETSPEKDLFIEFHWDGLLAKNLGTMKIWFNAVGYSQIAGQYGLRKVLNEISNKNIYLISHSRGASVILSALSNPRYNEDFAADTQNLYDIDVWDADPLMENNNNITALFLAAAIGEVDFKNPCNSKFRPFTNQLKQINFTINGTDPILRKAFNKANKFNPTDFGYKDITYKKLKPFYGERLDATDIIGLKSHKFVDYIGDPSFKKLLEKSGIKTRNIISNN